jgi:tyrosinase
MAMAENHATRREFLEIAAATAGLAILGATPGARAQPPALRVRRNLGKLDLNNPQDKKVLDQYTQGVRVLRRRSAANRNDQRGWDVQAGLHTYRCQHGDWWFLPWHRAYLYYFERMIQDAIGDPTFALPYWDWTDSSQLTLPAPFRDANSPLYDANRLPFVNDGSAQLDWSFYDQNFGGILNYVLDLTNFVPSFGSPAEGSSPGLERAHGQDLGHGDFEGGPHDSVHVWVAGGGRRDMGDPTFAALDPIFWLHHGNIDRLWSRWLARDPGHLNPTSTTWRNQRFQFVNTSGQGELITVSQVLDTRSAPLNYRYDDEPAQPNLVAQAPAPQPRREVFMMTQPAGGEAAATAGIETLTTAEPRFEVGTEPFTIALKVPPSSHARIVQALAAPPRGAAPAAQPRLLLVVEGIAFEDDASGVVEVFLNAPKAEGDRWPDQVHAVGTFTLFADHAHEPAPGAGARAGGGHQMTENAPPTDISSRRITRVFDVTETIRRLRAAGHWNESEIRVTLLRRSLHPGKRPVEGKVTFSRATIRTAPAQ